MEWGYYVLLGQRPPGLLEVIAVVMAAVTIAAGAFMMSAMTRAIAPMIK